MTDHQPATLFGVMSPNVLKVAIMLEELQRPYVLRYVGVFKGEQFTPEFLAMNPLGKVPVLQDPAFERPLAESGAILIALAERSGAFLPTAPTARYEVLQWLMVQMSTIGPMLGQFTHFKLLPEESDPYARARYAALAQRLYGLLDERLQTREWLAGDDYSIADIATFPWGEYIDRHGFDVEGYPALLRWRNQINARPAVKRAKARMAEAFIAPSTENLQSATPADLDRFFGRTEDMPSADYSAVTRMR